MGAKAVAQVGMASRSVLMERHIEIDDFGRGEGVTKSAGKPTKNHSAPSSRVPRKSRRIVRNHASLFLILAGLNSHKFMLSRRSTKFFIFVAVRCDPPSSSMMRAITRGSIRFPDAFLGRSQPQLLRKSAVIF